MDIDFYVRIVRTGTVLGAHAGLQPDRLRAHHRPLRFSDLRAALEARGVELIEVPGSQPDPDFTDFRAPGSGMVVIVHRPDDEVYKIYSQFRELDSWIARRTDIPSASLPRL